MKFIILVKDDMICEKVDFDLAVKGNPSFTKVSEANAKSDQFFEKIERDDFEGLINKYSPKLK